VPTLCWWRPPCLLRRVIVNQVSDQAVSVQGVLWQTRGAWLTLKEPQLLRTGAPPLPIDGEVVVHRSQVAFLQVLP